MTGKVSAVATFEEIGRRIAAARARQRMSRAALADGADVSRDTLRKVEEGAPTQDAKRQAVLSFLNLDQDGLPLDPTSDSPGLRSASDAELLAEIARRFARQEKGGSSDVANAAQKMSDEDLLSTDAIIETD